MKPKRTGDEAASNDTRSTAHSGDALKDNADSENSNVDLNCVFARKDLREETTVQTTKPSAKFEDRREPALFGCIPDPVAHI